MPNDPDKFPFLVIGNKIDLSSNRMVSKQMGENWCYRKNSSLNYYFIETSAKDGHNNIEKAFDQIVVDTVNTYEYENEMLDNDFELLDYFSTSKSNSILNINLKNSEDIDLNDSSYCGC